MYCRHLKLHTLLVDLQEYVYNPSKILFYSYSNDKTAFLNNENVYFFLILYFSKCSWKRLQNESRVTLKREIDMSILSCKLQKFCRKLITYLSIQKFLKKIDLDIKTKIIEDNLLNFL